VTLRLPTLSQAQELAAFLKAKGYPPEEAAENYRHAFPGDECNDGCLMFEGQHKWDLDRWPEEWAASAVPDYDPEEHAWLNALTWSALMTLAAEAGEKAAQVFRDEEIAYCARTWRD
jgi:hypothetical protein